jgi:hypothetical protein
MQKLGAVNDANYCNYMERKLRAWYRRFPPKQAAADSAADVAAEIAAPAEAEGSAPAADAAVELHRLLMSDGE